MRIQVRGLRRAQGSRLVLDGLDLVVPSGGARLLLGANGSGKSTLLRCLAGLAQPDGGEVLLDGRPVSAPEARDGVGALWPAAPSGERTWRQLQRALDRPAVWSPFDEDALADVPLRRLSSGQRRRVQLALALTLGRRALLLDEPLSQLDRPTRALVVSAVCAARERGVTVLVATHDPEVWQPLAADPFHLDPT
jgi:ABC-type multidrug transport system ATPase subunit